MWGGSSRCEGLPVSGFEGKGGECRRVGCWRREEAGREGEIGRRCGVRWEKSIGFWF